MLQLLTRTTLKEDKKGTSGDDKKYIGDQDHCHHDEQEQHLWVEVDRERARCDAYYMYEIRIDFRLDLF